MTMYDRDPNFEEAFSEGDRFVVMSLQYEGKINTRFGEAEKSRITIITRESYPERVTYSVLGAGFANLAKRATSGDFPHVAEFVVVPLSEGRTVKRLAPVDVTPKEFVDGEDGPAIEPSDFAPAPSGNGGEDAGPGF